VAHQNQFVYFSLWPLGIESSQTIQSTWRVDSVHHWQHPNSKSPITLHI